MGPESMYRDRGAATASIVRGTVESSREYRWKNSGSSFSRMIRGLARDKTAIISPLNLMLSIWASVMHEELQLNVSLARHINQESELMTMDSFTATTCSTARPMQHAAVTYQWNQWHANRSHAEEWVSCRPRQSDAELHFLTLLSNPQLPGITQSTSHDERGTDRDR